MMNKYQGDPEGAAGYALAAPYGERNGANPNGNHADANVHASQDNAPDIENIGITKALADTITATEHFAVDIGGRLYRYSGGAYRSGGERFIKRRTKEILEAWGKTKAWSSYRANEVTEYLKADARELWLKPPVDEINVQDGILNLYTKELREHSPECLSAVQIPVKFDPDARPGAWEKYIVPCFPSDAPELPYEIAANIVAPYKANQKAVLLSGEGDNGKSTYLSALLALLGTTNATNMSLHRLETDRFSMARLVGKLANVCPDLPSSHLNDTSIFKALTGDEAQLTAEYKHKDSFEFEPFAKLVFSANHPPRSSDASHAFFRRWVVAPFERTFTEEERIPREKLDAKLTTSKELSGVLNKVLEVLPRVRKQGFTESEKMREAWEEFRQTTDPISVWLDKNTVTGPDVWVTKAALLSAYNSDDANSGRIMTMTGFTQALNRLRSGLQIGFKTVNGKRERAWIGMGLKSSGPDDGGGSGGGSPNQGPGAYYSNEPAQPAQLSTNCNEKVVSVEQRQEVEEESPTSCNKRKVVKPVHPVHGKQPSVDAAVEAMRNGNAPRKVMQNVFAGTQKLPDLARSVTNFYGAKRFDGWEAWLEPTVEAFDRLTTEADAKGGAA